MTVKGRGEEVRDYGGENKHIFEMPVLCQRSGQAKCMLRCEIVSDGCTHMYAHTHTHSHNHTTMSGSQLKLRSPPVDGEQKPVTRLQSFGIFVAFAICLNLAERLLIFLTCVIVGVKAVAEIELLH